MLMSQGNVGRPGFRGVYTEARKSQYNNAHRSVIDFPFQERYSKAMHAMTVRMLTACNESSETLFLCLYEPDTPHYIFLFKELK